MHSFSPQADITTDINTINILQAAWTLNLLVLGSQSKILAEVLRCLLILLFIIIKFPIEL